MSSKKISVLNLDKLVSEMMHRPRVDGHPLYTRVDNMMETGDGVTLKDVSDKWDRLSRRSYNSPDNIRRLFITYKSVYVQYYARVVGDSSKSLSKYKNFPIAFDKVLNSMQMTYMNGGIPEYKVKGYGISALYKPWVCSNIEEVYFDWSIFLSEDIANMGMGDLLTAYTSIQSDKMLDYRPIKQLFEHCCTRNINNIRDRYPRLKCIGYISNLEDLYNVIDNKPGQPSVEDMDKLWSNNELVIQSIKDPNISVSLYRFEDIPKLNSKFSIKDGIYLYDRDVLKLYAAKLEKRIVDYKNDKAKDEELPTNTTRSRVEELLDGIYNNGGMPLVKMYFTAACAGADQGEIDEVYNGLSKSAREKYKYLFE